MTPQAALLSTDSGRWAETLDRLDHDFYHLASYSRLEAGRLGGEARAFLYSEADELWFVPLILRPIPGSDRHDAMSAYGYPGPLTTSSDHNFHQRAVAGMVQDLRARGLVSTFVRSHPQLSTMDLLRPMGELVLHGETVVIDLTLTEEEMWRQVRRDHRNQINRARRSDWQVSIDPEWQRFEDFLVVYRQSMTRVGATEEYFFDRAYFDGLRQAVGARMVLCSVLLEDQTLCAGLFSRSGDVIQFHLSGTHDDFLRQRPSKLMLDAVRRWGKEQGARHFHLGGGVGARQDSLFEFKAGFSKLRCPFHTWRLIIDPESYRELSSGSVDREVSASNPGFFPLYRST